MLLMYGLRYGPALTGNTKERASVCQSDQVGLRPSRVTTHPYDPDPNYLQLHVFYSELSCRIHHQFFLQSVHQLLSTNRSSIVFTLKTVMTSLSSTLLFLTLLQGKETNFRGHKLTQNKVQKNNDKIKKTQRKSQYFKNMIQVPKNNRFRKTRSRLGQENPKKEVEPIAPNSEQQHWQPYSRLIYYTLLLFFYWKRYG